MVDSLSKTQSSSDISNVEPIGKRELELPFLGNRFAWSYWRAAKVERQELKEETEGSRDKFACIVWQTRFTRCRNKLRFL